jgi:peptidoglycan hydrolase CwlO-like protein
VPAVWRGREQVGTERAEEAAEELAGQRADIQAQADELSGQVASQTEKLAVLSAKLDVTNAQLDNLSEQIDLYTNSIAEMENELNVNAQKESELLETYKIRIRVMEENGGLTYLAILFGAASFEDLLSRLNSVGEIMEYDNGLIKDLRAAQEAVKSAKAEMETEMAEQEDVFAAYQEKQADLAVQQEEAADILESLEADSAEYAAQLASVKALQSSLTDKISNMEAQLASRNASKPSRRRRPWLRPKPRRAAA